MSPAETNIMPDFEREIYVNMLIKDIIEEKNAYEKK